MARSAAFIFWKKDRAIPDFFENPAVNFPDNPGIFRFDDGTIMFAMHFSPTAFSSGLLMVNALKDGLEQLKAAAGDEWEK